MVRTHRARAFTLVELLVVAAILGLLVAIVLPSLKRAVVCSQGARCASQLRDLLHALYAYAVTEQAMPLKLRPDTTNADPEQYKSYGIEAPVLLYPFLRNWDAFVCPSDDHARPWDAIKEHGGEYFESRYSYGLNRWVLCNAGYGITPRVGFDFQAHRDDVGPPPPQEPEDPALLAALGAKTRLGIEQVPRPAERVAWQETYAGTGMLQGHWINDLPFPLPAGLPFDPPDNHKRNYVDAMRRHAGGMNLGFLDGHVQPVAIQVLPAADPYYPDITNPTVDGRNYWGEPPFR